MAVSEELGSRHEVRLGAGARTFVPEDGPPGSPAWSGTSWPRPAAEPRGVAADA